MTRDQLGLRGKIQIGKCLGRHRMCAAQLARTRRTTHRSRRIRTGGCRRTVVVSRNRSEAVLRTAERSSCPKTGPDYRRRTNSRALQSAAAHRRVDASNRRSKLRGRRSLRVSNPRLIVDATEMSKMRVHPPERRPAKSRPAGPRSARQDRPTPANDRTEYPFIVCRSCHRVVVASPAIGIERVPLYAGARRRLKPHGQITRQMGNARLETPRARRVGRFSPKEALGGAAKTPNSASHPTARRIRWPKTAGVTDRGARAGQAFRSVAAVHFQAARGGADGDRSPGGPARLARSRVQRHAMRPKICEKAEKRR